MGDDEDRMWAEHFAVHQNGEQLGGINPPLGAYDGNPDLDAIVIPGGGLQESGEVNAWIKASLDEAVKFKDDAKYIITLSRGTPYKVPVIVDGKTVDESVAAANYLAQKGVPTEKLIAETCSMDTLGNAYFLRVSITDPMGLRRLLIINPAARAMRISMVFAWVFNELSPPQDEYAIHMLKTPNIGLVEQELRFRVDKEMASSVDLHDLIPRIKTLEELSRYVHTEHGAYAVKGHPNIIDARFLRAY